MGTEKPHVEMTMPELQAEALIISEHAAQSYLTPRRREQIRKELAYILFEADCQRGAYPMLEFETVA